MKVKFLKGHNRHKAGEVADVIAEAANYYIKCKVAVEVSNTDSSTLPAATGKKAPTKKK